MTTDITELAQRMKAAAKKATQGEWRRASTQFNGITATPFMLGRKEVMIAGASEKRDAEFIAMANPANVLALVEALEKAQTKAVEQGSTACELFDEITALRKRIAELQIVSDKCFLSGLKTGWEYGITHDAEGYNREISDAQAVIDRAAGIKVEGE